ncbi:4206_t:CDS:1, partial [Cetraspora pellucida]
SATLGQLLQYPNQRKNLAGILRRPLPPHEANLLNSETTRRTTAARCYVRIHNNPVIAVLDSGAAISIMSSKLRHKLGLEINDNSITTVIMATSARAKTLGRVKDVEITIQDVRVPIFLQIIEFPEETLLLETDWFQKANAQLYFDSQKLRISNDEKAVEIPISNTGIETLTPSYGKQEYDSDGGDTFDEFDYEEDNLEEIDRYFTDEWSEVDNQQLGQERESEENPALFLTDINEPPLNETEG